MSERLFGGFGELPLRDSCAGAARGTKDRALYEVLEHIEELRETLRLLAHDYQGECCWCAVTPFDDGSTREWRHDERCREIRALL